MKRPLLPLVALLFCFTALSGRAAPAPTATEFLTQSMSRYQQLKSFGAQCAWSDAFPGITQAKAAGQVTDTRTFLYAAPNRFKVVSTHPGFVQTSVSDGVHVAEYTSMASLPAQTYPAPASLAAATTMQMQHPMFCGTLLYQFFGGPGSLPHLAQTAKMPISFGPDVTLDGEPCRTVRFYGTRQYGHVQVAISTRDLLVRRIVYDSAPLLAMMHDPARNPNLHTSSKTPLPKSSVTTELYTQIRTDPVIADAAFDTTVPTGLQATAMAAPADASPPVPVGQPAPDFSVSSLSGGRSVRLSSLRGRVVLLDFWATWCPPCRRGLPETQKLAAQYGGKGLAVLAISDETLPTIAQFVKANHYSFPAYRDAVGQANKAYKINAIPTVAVIDRAGNLCAFFVGLQDPQTIVAALKKAGLQTQ